ncbi:hypothetical protein DCCM_2701 [Desulfocucumis palustris]|uniref:LysM domain-containing protein n=1 Tax=Desulfocucumis palustris TaxID=1898651 RepID=A0A2L2XBK3_9FIRM|nr:LysM peptidoglycan-binding domain-containing protein [Desulfocucumis palustris]GBF33595.1 hypothetical protein DCCM_2701 [Desulfocucumis palustris]
MSNLPETPASAGQENSNSRERYTVKSGDSMWSIAKQFGVTLQEMVEANNHITNPEALNPGDELKVPENSNFTQASNIALPCCLIMERTGQSVPADALGTALIRQLVQIRPGRSAITIAASGLPAPMDLLGGFNGYQGIAFIPGEITWQWPLFPTAESIPTWSGTFTEITAALTTAAVIQVRPLNSATGQAGNPLLSVTLTSCQK